MDAISCLAPPPPPALLPTSAIARALHFSSSTTTTTTSPDSSSSSSLSLSHHQYSSSLLADLPSPYYALPPPHAVAPATCCDSVLVADSPPRRRTSPTAAAPGRQTHRHHALAPAGARAGKRRSRASNRAPTTYISTDPANFRLMVQHITGVRADLMAAGDAAGGPVVDAMMLQVQAAALLGTAGNTQLLPAVDEASALRQHQLQLELQQQQQQPCFPTLDSWNVMCETLDSADML